MKTHSSMRFEARMAKSAESYSVQYDEHFLTSATQKLEEICVCNSLSFC